MREDIEKAIRTDQATGASLRLQVDIAESLNRIANVLDNQSKARR